MTHDFEPQPRKTHGARLLLLAGVAGAGLLGVGLGIWARPAMSERRMAAAPIPVAAPAQKRQLQIVLDEAPAPIGAPIEVLPDYGDAPVRMVDDAEPEPQAPVRAPQGLMRVESRPPIVAEMAEPPPRPKSAPVLKAPKPKALQIAAASPKPAKAKAVKAKPAETRLAKATAAHRKADIQLAKAEPKPKSKKHAPLELAQAKAKPQGELARMRKMLAHLAPRSVKAEPAPRLEKVKYDPHAKAKARKDRTPKAEKAKLQKAKVEKARIQKVDARKARPPVRHEAPRAAPQPIRPSGLMKVSNRSRCGQSDPGAALVCADPALGAADRQMSRAYHDARAAGVSDAQLQHQQRRWLAARSAAAREAPWAVHDVYLARIAELRGMAQEADGGGQ